ncbi:MAG: hypothetical protein WAV32_09145 [Halobacteriota archaeon]
MKGYGQATFGGSIQDATELITTLPEFPNYVSIGEGYDLVFASHVIYEWKGHLEDILKRINKAMVPGGVFVSNHLSMDDNECGPVSSTMVELMTRLMGYPTHHLSEDEDIARK